MELTENYRHENDRPSKLQDIKLQDVKLTEKVIENAFFSLIFST